MSYMSRQMLELLVSIYVYVDVDSLQAFERVTYGENASSTSKEIQLYLPVSLYVLASSL